MKYVLLGNLSPEWASNRSGSARPRQSSTSWASRSSRSTTRRATTISVDIVDASNPEAMLAFSIWYSTQGLGRVQSMPAFDAKSFETAIKDAAG